jgi:ribonuclease D
MPGASEYFLQQLKELESVFSGHPFKIKNHADARRFDKQLKHTGESIKESIAKMECCTSGFRMIDFLQWKKKFSEKELFIKSSYSAVNREKPEAPNTGLNEMLSELRKKFAEEGDVPHFLVFSNYAIKNCCEMLPGDLDSLLAVGGFGKKKVEQYGKEVIEIILSYCKEQGITPKTYSKELKKEKELQHRTTALSKTVLETVELFLTGKSISEIMTIRKLAESTIEGHLAVGIRNKLLDIHSILKNEDIEEMKNMFESSRESSGLSGIRQKSNSKFSFGKLKMVQSWLAVAD